MKPDLFDYAVIVAATAGTLVYLFLMILIVGYRRRRTFERVLFFLALAAFCLYAGSLLAINASLYYSELPDSTRSIAFSLIAFGGVLLPGLLIQSHVSYTGVGEGHKFGHQYRALVIAGYAFPLAYFAYGFYFSVMQPGFYGDLEVDPFPSSEYEALRVAGVLVFAIAFGFCAVFQLRLASNQQARHQLPILRLHKAVAVTFALIGLVLVLSIAESGLGGRTTIPILLFAGIAPGAALTYAIVRHGFLGIGTQKNLVYGVTAGFLAILYLALVRRVSGWAEPYFPPEATSAVLIFVLIGFFEPLQRFANRVLRRNAKQQLEQLQRMTNELQREAREGELPKFLAAAEKRIREEFGLEAVNLNLQRKPSGVRTPEGSYEGRSNVTADGLTRERAKDDAGENRDMNRPAWAGQPVRFALGKTDAEVGELIAIPIGSSISGETHAALEFLAEQLPGIIELCCAVDEKSRLERELAERERLALVGQMTASISHNLKNPLGSMKTVLQVQLENEALDESVRRDLQMVLSELDRLAGKLNALLRYARPAVRGGEESKPIEIARVAKEVTALMEHEARRRGVSVELHEAANCGCIRGNEEALNDILSNLIVNAMEAVGVRGRVEVRLGGDERDVEIVVADDGPGISGEQQARLFQPFFTTKASGTGLGLAIVRRRATELGGAVSCRSPIAEGQGAEFIVRLPRMKC